MSAAKIKHKIVEAREDPGKFIELVFQDQKGRKLKLQPFHWEWVDILQKHRRVQIEASRSHGKTTVILGYLLWRIGSDPSIRIKLFTQSEEKARERLTVIGDLITTNRIVKLVFPDLRPAKNGVWHKTAIQVDRPAIGAKDPTLEASGIMGSVEGGRADLLVFDDICVAKGTPVISRRGLIPIEQVKPDDWLRNHLGTWSRVGLVVKRQAPRLLGLTALGCDEPTWVTPNHPVYAAQELKGQSGYSNSNFFPADHIQAGLKAGLRWFLVHPAHPVANEIRNLHNVWDGGINQAIHHHAELLRPVQTIEELTGDFTVYNLQMDRGAHSYEGPGLVSHNCDFRTSIIYPMHREAIKKKLYAEIMPMLEEDGSAISIATPHHAGDAVSSLRSNREWKSYIFSVGAPDDPYLPLWPSRWSREALKKLRNEIGPIEYDRAYRCISVSGASQIVQPEHIQYYTAEMLPDPWGLTCIQSYDLAGTVKKKSSYFACVTILYDGEANTIYVADAWHNKLSFADQASAIVKGAAKWQPERIVIEQTGYQSALREYLLELAKEPLPIVAMTPGSKSKEIRLTETLPMFEAGRIFFNPSLDPGANPDRTTKGDIVGQLLDFTNAHDQDLGDAFAYGVRMCRAFRQMDDDDTWADGDGVATRMSIIGS